MSRTVWTVPGLVVRVVDGDTVRLLLDLGWGVSIEKNARIIGIDAPEMGTPEGAAAKAYAAELLPVGTPVTFVSHQLDKYGRPLGQLFMAGGTRDFAVEMLAAKHAATLTY